MADNPREFNQRLEKDQVFAAARGLCQQWADEALQPYFQRLDDKLFSLSEKAGNNADQGRYFQSRDEVNRRQPEIRQQFLQHFDAACGHYFQGMNTTTDFSADPHQTGRLNDDIREEDLGLIDNTELEEKIAVASMSRKCCADNSEALYALNQRLAALRGGIKVGNHSNPFAPGVFAEALQQALAALTLDENARLMIYKVFENTFMTRLKSLYEQLNSKLSELGVLPNLRYQIKKTPEEILAGLPEELKSQLSDMSRQHQLELIRAIQVVQRQLAPNPVYQLPAGVAPITVDQLLGNIQQLQVDSGAQIARFQNQQAFATVNTADLRQQLSEQIRRSTDIDQGVIEIVGLLFEYMLNDNQLPDSVKSLLSYLHTPFLKIALVDKDFFNQPDHPARQLLNSLVAAGERWVEPHSKRKSEVFEQIRKVVQRVLNEFNNDVRLFSELAFEFNHYLRQHSRRIRMTEKRAQQAALGENKVREIRTKVDNYIRTKIGTVRLNPVVSTLLYEPWANFLAFNLLRFGSRSDQWRQAAQVIDDVVWYFQPRDMEGDIHARKRIEELQATLPEVLQAGFDTVGYDRNQGQRLIDVVRRRSDDHLADRTLAATPEPEIVDIDQMEDHSADQGGEDDPLIGKLRNLKFDTWFEFDSDTADEEPVRAKLAWSNRKSLHFMFVNRLGQQVAVKSGSELARELREGKARMLSAPGETPFFEKAMEDVLEQIKQRLASSQP